MVIVYPSLQSTQWAYFRHLTQLHISSHGDLGGDVGEADVDHLLRVQKTVVIAIYEQVTEGYTLRLWWGLEFHYQWCRWPTSLQAGEGLILGNLRCSWHDESVPWSTRGPNACYGSSSGHTSSSPIYSHSSILLIHPPYWWAVHEHWRSEGYRWWNPSTCWSSRCGHRCGTPSCNQEDTKPCRFGIFYETYHLRQSTE